MKSKSTYRGELPFVDNHQIFMINWISADPYTPPPSGPEYLVSTVSDGMWVAKLDDNNRWFIGNQKSGTAYINHVTHYAFISPPGENNT